MATADRPRARYVDVEGDKRELFSFYHKERPYGPALHLEAVGVTDTEYSKLARTLSKLIRKPEDVYKKMEVNPFLYKRPGQFQRGKLPSLVPRQEAFFQYLELVGVKKWLVVLARCHLLWLKAHAIDDVKGHGGSSSDRKIGRRVEAVETYRIRKMKKYCGVESFERSSEHHHEESKEGPGRKEASACESAKTANELLLNEALVFFTLSRLVESAINMGLRTDRETCHIQGGSKWLPANETPLLCKTMKDLDSLYFLQNAVDPLLQAAAAPGENMAGKKSNETSLVSKIDAIDSKYGKTRERKQVLRKEILTERPCAEAFELAAKSLGLHRYAFDEAFLPVVGPQKSKRDSPAPQLDQSEKPDWMANFSVDTGGTSSTSAMLLPAEDAYADFINNSLLFFVTLSRTFRSTFLRTDPYDRYSSLNGRRSPCYFDFCVIKFYSTVPNRNIEQLSKDISSGTIPVWGPELRTKNYFALNFAVTRIQESKQKEEALRPHYNYALSPNSTSPLQPADFLEHPASKVLVVDPVIPKTDGVWEDVDIGNDSEGSDETSSRVFTAFRKTGGGKQVRFDGDNGFGGQHNTTGGRNDHLVGREGGDSEAAGASSVVVPGFRGVATDSFGHTSSGNDHVRRAAYPSQDTPDYDEEECDNESRFSGETTVTKLERDQNGGIAWPEAGNSVTDSKQSGAGTFLISTRFVSFIFKQSRLSCCGARNSSRRNETPGLGPAVSPAESHGSTVFESYPQWSGLREAVREKELEHENIKALASGTGSALSAAALERLNEAAEPRRKQEIIDVWRSGAQVEGGLNIQGI
ncbi:hypothetical protein BJ508DRAFT_339540 [Ascobolus immersus RN42]|uniref:Uncharacterized protein n=1 Tax=Ascobolus immersus RN42 TaxID=1160509 RepID=A0A3N4HR73_ASCIM|nr:hypothetical protein BJ508DRAFT_339540 [Ascobolus immersus RN42]